MINLLLSIICSVLIGNLLFLFQKDKKLQILQVFLGNYFLASIFSLTANNTPLAAIRSYDVIIGIMTGLLFLSNFIVYQKNIKVNGLSLSVGIMRISLIIPTVISIVVFSENIMLLNYIGIAVILFSFTFRAETRKLHNLFWIIFLFMITGFTDSMLKIYDVHGLPQDGAFVSILFGSAFIFNLIWIGVQKRKIVWKYFAWGMLLGIPNQLTTRFFLDSLESVKAAIAYPLFASCVVLITVLCDLFLWKKKFRLNEKIAFILLIIGIIFLNLQK
ncbi:MAG: EamA family transporter [Candidatus Cloacimonetes bacterium]|nr:EamA family transporter [Candidatus Cloacimonadota bacterium]